MTLVDRSLRRRFTTAMALAMALALLLSGTALAAVDIDPACADAPDAGFPDISGNTHEDAINCIAWYEVTQGTSDGDYEPAKAVPRWQMALFIYRTAQYMDEFVDENLPEADGSHPFTDVDQLGDDEAKEAIEVLHKIDVVNGTTATTYEPYANVKRDQMASFINRLQEWATGITHGGDANAAAFGYTDVKASNVHGPNIADLTEAGIVEGFGDGTYGPRMNVRRDQMGSYLARNLAVNVNLGVIEPKAGETSGEVTLDADQAQAGSSVTGSVDEPGSVESVAVSGCGFANDTVDIEGDGTFELTIPSEQEAGTCELTFTVKRTDGSSTETVIPFMVIAAPQTLTDAPDLVSASVNGSDDTVTYVFDEAANGKTPVFGEFHIYDAAGAIATPAAAADVEISGSDPTKVIADYSGGAVDVEDATLATIGDDAVEDASGASSYASGAGLNAQTLAAGVTTAPDLESVSDIRAQGGELVADFRFDEAIATALNTDTDGDVLPAVPAQAPVVAGLESASFLLHTADGTQYMSTTIENISADDRTLTVAFGDAPTTLPASQVVRGGAVADAVQDDDGPDGNPQQTAARTGDPAFSGGAVADRTDTPDIVSAKVIGDDEVAFEFDEAVTNTPVATAFNLYGSAGTDVPSTAAERSDANANVVNVTFPSAAVASAVGASANAAAVTAVSDTETNLVHEVPLADVSFSAGRTALADLVSVDISVDAFGDADVVYTFDDDVPLGVTLADFALVDAQGTRFTPTGAPEVDGDTVTFDGDAAGGEFTNSEAAAAVVGSVEDDSAAGTDMTEGDVTVSRDTSS